jgi:hypothetical protein
MSGIILNVTKGFLKITGLFPSSPLFLPYAKNHPTRTEDDFSQHLGEETTAPANLRMSRSKLLFPTENLPNRNGEDFP